MEKLNYKNENIERKFLKNMQKSKFLKIKNSLLELENDFIELKDEELKDREVRIKKEMKKGRPIKKTWYDWLINYISEPIRESMGGFKDKCFSDKHT